MMVFESFHQLIRLVEIAEVIAFLGDIVSAIEVELSLIWVETGTFIL